VFQTVVERAFAQWTFTDPASGLGSNLAFVADFATPVAGGYAAAPRSTCTAYNHQQLGRDGFDAATTTDDITLTSGTTGYGGVAIAGAEHHAQHQSDMDDPKLPDRPRPRDRTRARPRGRGPVLGPGGIFIDDNYDGSTRATAKATLMNSFAALIDPYDPRAPR
jgi:hypothetical protein